MHERFKRFTIARLCAFDKDSVIWRGQGSPRVSDGRGAFSLISATLSRPCDRHSVGCHLAAFSERNAAYLPACMEHALLNHSYNSTYLDAGKQAKVSFILTDRAPSQAICFS